MSQQLTELKQQVQHWARTWQDAGLFATGTVDALDKLSAQTPATLFAASERPLVVGFFGGTGVGKSTLLNRLAGEPVARTSVERPTSREVTMYLHESVQIDHLPAEFPVEKINQSIHSKDENRHILWIDMPDFDSAESTNRKLVNDWLPHIDLLIYVVSPERYRDDHGWRLLKEHGMRHAWCFVINHWDRGDEVQRRDFRHMLEDAGLTDPLLFCTDSSGGTGAIQTDTQDEFPALKNTVAALADRNTLAQLEARGVSVRVTEMQVSVEALLQTLGSTEQHQQLKTRWHETWHTHTGQITSALQWKFSAIAQRYSDRQPGLLVSVIRSLRGEEPAAPDADHSSPSDAAEVFDDDSFALVSNALGELVPLTVEHQLPAPAIRQGLRNLTPSLRDSLNGTVHQHLQQSLAAPGTPLQRLLYRTTGLLTTLLPLLAIVWAGYHVVTAFHAGKETPAAYVSSNFAINAGLLVLLAWAVPFFLRRLLRPSPRQAAYRGLKLGTLAALAHVNQQSQLVLEQLGRDCEDAKEQAQGLFVSDATAPETSSVVLDRAVIRQP